MPKKFAGENSKAVAARQRKENSKLEKDQKTKKMVEDAEWEDNDDKLKKKQQKKEDQEKKRLEQLQKKAEAKALLEKEMESIKPKAVPPPAKITRAQITHMKERTIKAEPEKPVPTRVVVEEPPLVENLNRLQIDGEVAQSVDEAISILTEKSDTDRHPEKRLKAAYTAFEEVTLPRLKAENPTLRLSQLKQMLRKEWLKSPQNPLNQNS
ncbi:coiled-coil domain-containing protein 124 [Maniola jurtina]|uniref:coiled-coil domain-containing protein 124 n=1 Tax=Maniola jurtina TaxID=191418 RepID=UPI001E68F90F|nr:coiled-coil domain-containing protein 124 [Maniola jurtina]XP_045779329.1 coiled-coil domain-containing protein 124 [Maniola jurtina]XP_045779340.1 coiled-coil domain-containing protein 124 [Maniola jurtina]